MSTRRGPDICTRQRPIPRAAAPYHEQRYFKRLAAIKPPATSDCTMYREPARRVVREKEQAMRMLRQAVLAKTESHLRAEPPSAFGVPRG